MWNKRTTRFEPFGVLKGAVKAAYNGAPGRVFLFCFHSQTHFVVLIGPEGPHVIGCA